MQTNLNPSTEQNINLFPELDLKVYFRVLWHWAWLIILCSLLAAAAAYTTSLFAIPIYQASTTLLVDEARNPDANYQDLLVSERIARTYAELMKRPTTLAQVATKFGIEPNVLNDAITAITVTPLRDTQLIKVTVEGVSPELVAAVADTLPEVFIADINTVQTQRFAGSKQNLEQQLAELNNQIELQQVAVDDIGKAETADEAVRLGQLQNELAQTKNSYANLLRSYEELRLTEVQSVDSIVIVEKAHIPSAPIRPRILLNTLLATVVGAMLALGVVLLLEYMDDRIKTPQDLLNIINTPILGTIARLPQTGGRRKQNAMANRQASLITSLEPRHPVTEAYRSLRTNLQFSSVDETLRSLLVTSATPGEGKTTTAANLAVVLAQAGKAVILIDADIRKPQQHKIFDLPKSPGITEAMVSSNTPIGFFLRDTQVPNLRILTSGKEAPNPAELLGSNRMKQLLQSLQQEADFLVVDAPPLLAVTDAQVLANDVQGVLLVVNTEKTPRAMVARGAEAIQRANGRILGVVLNRLSSSARGYYYYYDSYSYYYENDEDGGDGDNKPKRKEGRQKQQDKSQGGKKPLLPQPQALFENKLMAKTELNGLYSIQVDPNQSQ
ncbi:MAG: polysaccharide biosynthesis tyrosine autokinase [Caldilinea sp. CFX5]|nr:polysaccharide biosynthesis tyrosine autokinase [Caldilinea sp. CFX5]